MAYELATPEEAALLRDPEQKPYPWAAGEPGTLFDRPGDILWSNFIGMGDITKQFLKDNDIGDMYYPGSGVCSSGILLRTYQTAFKIKLRKEDGGNFPNLFRQIDVLLPEMLPIMVEVRRWREDNLILKGIYFDLFEPGLSEYACYTILYSGDTWMVVKNRYGSVEIEFEDTDREAFFTKVLERFGWSDEPMEDDEDDWD